MVIGTYKSTEAEALSDLPKAIQKVILRAKIRIQKFLAFCPAFRAQPALNLKFS